MSYARDTDDQEQCDQGAGDENDGFSCFVYEMYGRQQSELSGSELSNARFQWKLSNRKD